MGSIPNFHCFSSLPFHFHNSPHVAMPDKSCWLIFSRGWVEKGEYLPPIICCMMILPQPRGWSTLYLAGIPNPPRISGIRDGLIPVFSSGYSISAISSLLHSGEKRCLQYLHEISWRFTDRKLLYKYFNVQTQVSQVHRTILLRQSVLFQPSVI